MKKAAAAVSLTLALILTLTSCSSGLTIFSNYRRLENIELVRTVTADKSEGGMTVTICGTAGEQSDARMYERTGPSMAVALGELILMPLGREAILSHTENLLIGEELAETGISECLDYMERFSEMRLDTGILIVRNGTAKDLVAGLAGKETPAPDVIAGLGKNVARVGDGYFFTCREIASSLATNGCALIMCVRGEKEEKLFESRGDLDIEPAGFAVLREDGKPIYLTDEETFGTLLLLNKFRSKNIDLQVGDTTLTVSVDKAKASFKPKFGENDALLSLDVRLQAEANVICLKGPGDLMSTDYRREAERALNEKLRSAVQAALIRGQTINVDFLDIAGIIERREPIKFEKQAAGWDRTFPQLKIDTKVDSTLLRTFDIIDPPAVSGEEENKRPWEKLIESLRGS